MCTPTEFVRERSACAYSVCTREKSDFVVSVLEMHTQADLCVCSMKVERRATKRIFGSKLGVEEGPQGILGVIPGTASIEEGAGN